MQKNYRVFLLRIWEDESDLAPHLRILLENPKTHALLNFFTTQDLQIYLDQLIASREDTFPT